MAKPHERAFALIFALLFLFSSVALSGAVIYTMLRNDESTPDTSTTIPSDTNQPASNVTVEDSAVLKGTNLENFEPVDKVDQLKIVDLKEGDGEEVKAGATVTAHYTGAFVSNGLIFESSKDGGQPIPFGLDQVIPGWTQGVPGMKVGGTRRLIIPGSLAYGDAPAGYTPSLDGRPMGPLVFDIELVDVKNP